MSSMFFLICIAALAACVWGLIAYRNMTMLQGLWLVLLAGSCVGHAFYHRSVGPLPITIDRILWGILVAHLGIAIVMGRAAKWKWQPADCVLIALLLWITINLGLSNATYAGYQPIATFLFFIVMPAGCYWVGRTFALGDADRKWLVAGSIAFGSYLALTAIAESRGWHGLVFPRYIVSEQHDEFFGRGRGPFLNPVVNGIVMITCMMTAMMSWKRAAKAQRIALAGFALLMLAGCFATMTRTVWLSAAFVSTIAVTIHMTPRRRVVFASGAMLLCGLLLVGAWDQLKAFKRDKNVSVEEMQQSAGLRPLLATVAMRMAADRPIIGHGLSQYPDNSPPYHFVGGDTQPVQMALPYVQHNVFLAVLVDLGVVGVAIFCALMICWIRDGCAILRDATFTSHDRAIALVALSLLSSYLINGMFHDVLIMPMLNMFLFSFTGMAAGIRMRHRAAATGDSNVETSEDRSRQVACAA